MNDQDQNTSKSIQAFNIIAMCHTEQEARAKEIELKKQGHSIIEVTKPTGNGPYGKFWLVMIPMEWPKITEKSRPCSYCNKSWTSLTDFFICWNCDSLECVMCATPRILDGKNKITPKLVGTCQNCGANWGFFNMAPVVRSSLAEQHPISENYYQMGILGSTLLDLWFLGLEVDDLNYECEDLAKDLPSKSQTDYNNWLMTLKTMRNNYKRMEKSLRYMIEKHYSCLNSEHAKELSLQDLPGPIYKKKLKFAQILYPLLRYLIKVLDSEEIMSNFAENVYNLQKKMVSSEEDFNVHQIHSIAELAKIQNLQNNTTRISELINQIILT